MKLEDYPGYFVEITYSEISHPLIVGPFDNITAAQNFEVPFKATEVTIKQARYTTDENERNFILFPVLPPD